MHTWSYCLVTQMTANVDISGITIGVSMVRILIILIGLLTTDAAFKF
jgi:hypothetical protein